MDVPSAGHLPLCDGTKAAPICAGTNANEAVLRAEYDLPTTFVRVASVKPAIEDINVPDQKVHIIIGTLDNVY